MHPCPKNTTHVPQIDNPLATLIPVSITMTNYVTGSAPPVCKQILCSDHSWKIKLDNHLSLLYCQQ